MACNHGYTLIFGSMWLHYSMSSLLGLHKKVITYAPILLMIVEQNQKCYLPTFSFLVGPRLYITLVWLLHLFSFCYTKGYCFFLMCFPLGESNNYFNAKNIFLVHSDEFNSLTDFHWPFQHYRSKQLFSSGENSHTCGFRLLCRINWWDWIWFAPWLNFKIGISNGYAVTLGFRVSCNAA